MKWSFVPRNVDKPKYIVVNADEVGTRHLQGSRADGERSAPADRRHPDRRPGRRCAQAGYIYIRGEYRYLIDIMDKAIAEAYARGGSARISRARVSISICYTHTGAGAYECGEESALLESLEGKRGIPRIRPPFPAVVGRVAVARRF